MNKVLSFCAVLIFSVIGTPVVAGNDSSSNGVIDDCDTSYNGLSIDEEFGDGINDITRCLKNENQIKLVMQVNQSCRDTKVVTDGDGYKLENHPKSCDPRRGFGIAQMKNMIRDYKETHSISAKQLDLKIIVHGGGGLMLIDDSTVPWTNNLQPAVEGLLEDGVRIYFCQNTVRGLAPKLFPNDNNDLIESIQALTSSVIDGVEYVTGGLTALADFQKEGYVYIQP